MSDESGQFSRALERLRNSYLASLGEKADELAQTVTQCRQGQSGARDALALLIHRLAGTAGSFGIGNVSDAAGALDERLHAGAAIDELTDEINALVQLLRDCCRHLPVPA